MIRLGEEKATSIHPSFFFFFFNQLSLITYPGQSWMSPSRRGTPVHHSQPVANHWAVEGSSVAEAQSSRLKVPYAFWETESTILGKEKNKKNHTRLISVLLLLISNTQKQKYGGKELLEMWRYCFGSGVVEVTFSVRQPSAGFWTNARIASKSARAICARLSGKGRREIVSLLYGTHTL